MADRKPFTCRDCGVPITLIDVPGRDRSWTMAFLVPPATVERGQDNRVSAVRLAVHDCPNRQRGGGGGSGGGGGGQRQALPQAPPAQQRPSTADEELPF